MCYENEFVIDKWYEVDDHKEHYGSTKFQEYDGTERKDETPALKGGIIGGLQDQDWDTADRDIYGAFLQENKDRVKRYIERAVKKAKEEGEDPYSAAYQAADFYDEGGLTDAEINGMIEAALNPTSKAWTIGFRKGNDPKIHTHETTAKDGLAAWQSIKDFYESGGEQISWVYTC